MEVLAVAGLEGAPQRLLEREAWDVKMWQWSAESSKRELKGGKKEGTEREDRWAPVGGSACEDREEKKLAKKEAKSYKEGAGRGRRPPNDREGKCVTRRPAQ